MGEVLFIEMQLASFNNTTFHHPQMGALGPHPRHSWTTDGARVDGHDIPFRTANAPLPAPYTGASYVREGNGAPVETVWTWGHPSSSSSSAHMNASTRVPMAPKQYEPPAHQFAAPPHMRDLNFVQTAFHDHGHHDGYDGAFRGHRANHLGYGV